MEKLSLNDKKRKGRKTETSKRSATVDEDTQVTRMFSGAVIVSIVAGDGARERKQAKDF